MWRNIFAKPILVFSFLLAGLLWLTESVFHYLVFDIGHPFEIIPSDTNELWMRLLLCALIVVFGTYIQHQSVKRLAIQDAKLRTLNATMHTVEDRIGNSLISIRYLLTDAEQNQMINVELAKDILDLIDDTMGELREIRSLKVISEKRFSDATYYLDTGHNPADPE